MPALLRSHCYCVWAASRIGFEMQRKPSSGRFINGQQPLYLRLILKWQLPYLPPYVLGYFSF